MPTPRLVTNPPAAMRTSVAAAVTAANRGSHPFSVGEDIKTKPLRPFWPAAAENWKTLLYLECEVRCGPAVFDFNVLRHHAGFSVCRLNLVFARRDIGDLECAVFAGDREIRVIEHADPGEHPGMNVTLEFQEILRFCEAESQVRAGWGLGLVLLCVAIHRRDGMNIVD